MWVLGGPRHHLSSSATWIYTKWSIQPSVEPSCIPWSQPYIARTPNPSMGFCEIPQIAQRHLGGSVVLPQTQRWSFQAYDTNQRNCVYKSYKYHIQCIAKYIVMCTQIRKIKISCLNGSYHLTQPSNVPGSYQSTSSMKPFWECKEQNNRDIPLLGWLPETPFVPGPNSYSSLHISRVGWLWPLCEQLNLISDFWPNYSLCLRLSLTL